MYQPTRMEKCPPGGDCASGEGDSSKSDNPPVTWTPNPSGEQAQGKRVSRGDGISQAASQSPELKRRKVSSTISDNQRHLKLFRKYVSRKAAGKGRAVLEGVGLDSETITACFSSHPLNEEEAVQAGLTKWCGGRGNEPPTWQVLFAAMEYAQIAKHHVHNLKKETGLCEPITEQHEVVTGGTNKSPKEECRSSTKEAATFSTRCYIKLVLVGLVFISSFLVFPVLQGPSSDQKAVARYRVEEEARKGSKGETSVVPGQVTGGPTAATNGRQPQTQVSGHPHVVEAAKLGWLSTVKELLDGGKATVEDRDKEETTALLWASYKGHLEVVKVLLNEYKADLFQKDKMGRNAMHCAALGGHMEVIEFLLPLFGERVHEKTNNSHTMLHLAAERGHRQLVQYFIEEIRMDPQDRDKWGFTVLLRAAYGGSVPLLSMLLKDYGSSVDELTENGSNALHLAALNDHLDLVKFLIPILGEKKFAVTLEGYTCLGIAWKKQNKDIVEYLIHEGGFSEQH